MALPPQIVPPLYPFVPPLPGVPALLRAVGAVFPAVVAATADGPGVPSSAAPQQWGIYLNGAPAITSDTVDDFEFRQDFRISSAPQEQGAFLSYNKVADAFDGKITFIQGGSIAQRAAMLQQIDAALKSLSTGYSLVMPEFVFASVNIVHQGIRRSLRSGVTLLLVDVWVEQVRVTGTSQFSPTTTPQTPSLAPGTTKNPEAAAPSNGGAVQPQQPTPSQNGPIGTTNLSGSSPPAAAVPAPPSDPFNNPLNL